MRVGGRDLRRKRGVQVREGAGQRVLGNHDVWLGAAVSRCLGRAPLLPTVPQTSGYSKAAVDLDWHMCCTGPAPLEEIKKFCVNT